MTDIVIREIRLADLDSICGACWENRETQMRLLEKQEILGMAAWEGQTCVGLLHGYSLKLSEWDDRDFPGYARNRLLDWPLGCLRCWHVRLAAW